MKMRVYHIGTFIGLAFLVLLGFQNCGGTSSKTSQGSIEEIDQASNQQRISELKGDIDELNAVSLFCRSDEDCKALGVGLRACGGPSRFIIASILNPEFDQIQALISEVEARERETAESSQLVGACFALTPPVPTCVQNICQ